MDDAGKKGLELIACTAFGAATSGNRSVRKPQPRQGSVRIAITFDCVFSGDEVRRVGAGCAPGDKFNFPSHALPSYTPTPAATAVRKKIADFIAHMESAERQFNESYTPITPKGK